MLLTDLKGDFGIITIREDECDAVLARFPKRLGVASGRRQYNIRELALGDGNAYTVAIVRCAGQGNGEAEVANALLEELTPRWLLVVGIAGGAPAFEFTLGDVVVSTEVCDFNVGAVLKDGSHEYALQGSVTHAEARKHAANLVAIEDKLGSWNSVKSIRSARPEIKLSAKSMYGDADWKKKVKKTLAHHLSGPPRAPKVLAGAIACSDLVMKDAELFQVWLKITRQVIAVEMESAGIQRAAHERQIPALSIRGISDIVGLTRNPLWTGYACHSAAAFARAFLLSVPLLPQAKVSASVRPVPPQPRKASVPAPRSPERRKPKQESAPVVRADTGSNEPVVDTVSEHTWDFEPVPKASVRIFRMAWQLETWLRLMVYVELRAGRTDWEAPFKFAGGWPPRSQVAEKRLHHMSTAHQAGISYLPLAQLWQIIIDDKNWSLFEPYFPPKNNAVAKMDEVLAIRNRLAHFRTPHLSDEIRLELFLRDFDQGVRQFCLRYTANIVLDRSSPDPVSAILSNRWEDWGNGFELHSPNGWLYASDPYRLAPYAHAELSAHACRSDERSSSAGLIYRLNMFGADKRILDIPSFLQNTREHHPNVIHIEIPSEGAVSVVLPAVVGASETAELIGIFLRAARSSMGPRSDAVLARRLRAEWPEYVLWPDHPLCFYCGDEPESIIRLDHGALESTTRS